MTTYFNTIGIIGGSGWMGRAMVQQLRAQRWLEKHSLWLSNRSGSIPEFKEVENIHVTADNEKLVTACDTIILSVRPHHFPDLKIKMKDQLVISVMAGVSVEQIEKITGAKYIIRTMPNAAIEIGESYTPWYASDATPPELFNPIQDWLRLFGTADQVAYEDLINFFTALTGSGHGWIAFFQACLIDAGLKHGLSQPIAQSAVRQLFLGMGLLMMQEKKSNEALITQLIDYAGTTAAGLNVMVTSHIKDDVINAIDASYRKAVSDMTKN